MTNDRAAPVVGRGGRGTPLPTGSGFPLVRAGLAAALLGAFIAARVTFDPYSNPDSHAFEALARSFLAGRGLVYHEPMLGALDLVAFRSPMYAIFLAPRIAIGGVPLAMAVQGAVAGFATAFVGAIAARLGGRAAGWVAWLLALVWPATWILAGQMMSETLYTALVLAATWFALDAATRGSRPRAGLAGGFAAAAILTRPTGVALLLALALWLVRSFPRGAAVFLAVALVAWAPWPARNAARLHAFVPLLTNGGLNAWTGNTGIPVSQGWDWMRDHAALGEVGLDRAFWARTIETARERPGLVAGRIVRKAVAFAVPLERGLASWAEWVALALALVALATPAWRARLALPAIVWAAHGAVTALSVVDARYRYPTEWAVVVAAAFGLLALAGRVAPRRLAA